MAMRREIGEPEYTAPLIRQDERMLVLAPLGRDSLLISEVLQQAGLEAFVCPTLAALCEEYETGGAGVLLLTSEALRDERLFRLQALLSRQPAWSDIPLILLSGASYENSIPPSMLFNLGNTTVLERPLRLSSLISAVGSALRARRRQYEVRELLAQTQRAREEAERQQAEIMKLNHYLQQAMTETHHRVKNNLQVIAALIDLQTMDGRDTVSVHEVTRLGRAVRMLAAVHDLLTQQARADRSAQYVSVRAVLDKLLPLLQQIASHHLIKTDVQDAELTTRQSTSLALVVNELVSNALKYGRNEVLVRFQLVDHSAVLEVLDDGPGFPEGFDARKAANTGLELVENLSRWDLAGGVTYANRPEGGGHVTVTVKGVLKEE